MAPGTLEVSNVLFKPPYMLNFHLRSLTLPCLADILIKFIIPIN